MRPKWLYCANDETWHLWPQSEPVDGDEAYCGHVKDDSCTIQGEGVNKCEPCVEATRDS